MRVQLKLVEAKPDTLWTSGEVKNVSAPGSPTITNARAALDRGTRFLTGQGTHVYKFLIIGDGAIKVQAFDADSGQPIAPATSFDTTEVHGGHAYVFTVT